MHLKSIFGENIMAADILHPLTRLDWKECPGCGIKASHVTIQTAVLQDRLYMEVVSDSERHIYATSSDLTSWTTLTTPPNVTSYGLTTYRSKLVVVGGIIVKCGERSQKLSDVTWVCDGIKGQWLPSLPPIPTPHYFPYVTNPGHTPECIIVSGGSKSYVEHHLDVVEVLMEEQWSRVQSLPVYPLHTIFALHNGKLYYSADNLHGGCLVHCKLEALLATGVQPGNFNMVESPEVKHHKIESNAVWGKTISKTLSPFSALFSFGQQLVAFQLLNVTSFYHRIYAFSPSTGSMWVYIGDTPKWFAPISCLLTSAGELVVIGSDQTTTTTSRYDFKVFKASPKKCRYDPGDHFSRSALSRLEAVGIPVMTTLSWIYLELAAEAGIPREEVMTARSSDKFRMLYGDSLDLVISLWLSGRSSFPPTWASLYQILRQLGCVELSHQIEDYLASTKTLKEVCTSVIMSALLQQRSLDPDELHIRLLDYVPTRVKHYLTHHFKQITDF